MWRLQGPAGLQVRLVGACRVGTGGISSSPVQCCVLQCRCSLGLLSGEKEGFHSFQTTPLWLLPHCFPPLQPLQSLHIGSKPSTGPDGVIDALTSAWDGQLGAGWLAGLGPVGYSSCLFQSSFPVLTNESCSFRGSHLGSHRVYWPGATSDFVSVSDQLCQLSLSRGLSLSSSLLVHWHGLSVWSTLWSWSPPRRPV